MAISLPGTKRNFAFAASLGHDAMASASAVKHADTASRPPGDRAGLDTKLPMRMKRGSESPYSKPSNTF